MCADQLALMIENARLTNRVVEQEKLRRDLALAAEVQKRLLPERPPTIALAALAAMSLPARTVGGDYYDFIDVGDSRIGIALADVAGKGVAAALIMSVVQASLRIISAEGEISLPRLAAQDEPVPAPFDAIQQLRDIPIRGCPSGGSCSPRSSSEVRSPAQPRRLGGHATAHVRAGPGGRPQRVNRYVVEAVRETWLVEDRWWTGAPLRRRYWEIVTACGRNLVVFRDLESGSWHLQR